MKHTSQLIAAACIAALGFAPIGLSAAGKKKAAASPSPSESASPSKSMAATTRPIPFHGMIAEVDHNAKTFSIAGKTTRVLRVTSNTVITKNGESATMNDIMANEKVSGSYWKAADGTMEAKTLKLEAAGAAQKKTMKPKKSASPAPSPEASPKS
jgi:hypothetical protein